MAARRLKPAGLVGQRIERFYGQVAQALAEARISDDMSLDMSSVNFVVPEGIIALVTAGRLWHGVTGNSVRLCGLAPLVHGYLERMNVFTTCGIWLKEESLLPAYQRFDRSTASQNLLEVIPIAGTEDRNAPDVHAAVTRANAIVGAWFDADADAIKRLLTMLSEVTSNITHSLDRGFATIQHYRGGGEKGGRVSIAVGDLGIGIEASLRSKRPSRRTSGKPGDPSFLLEVMALELLVPPFSGGYPYELKGFFASAAERIGDRWADPAGLGPDVSSAMTGPKVEAACRALRDAEATATRAILLKRRGNQGEALRTWRSLFGPQFPLS
jgi:hypothetical protein